MSGTGSWRLYPKRSIASHRFCGSGRLFRGFNDGKREAGSDMTWALTELVVARTWAIPNSRKNVSLLSCCQGISSNAN